MRYEVLLSVFTLVFCTHCSLNKSQGRRNFETDVQNRIPNTVLFTCTNLNLPNESEEIISWESLKMSSNLTVHESRDNQTVVLLASTVQPHRTCISESLDLAEY